MTFRTKRSGAAKAAFKAQVTRKQKAFRRFKKRFATTNNPTEKRFCKREASKVCKQLKTCARRYKKSGFGTTSWITKNFTMTTFTRSASRKSRRTTKRSHTRRTTRSYGRRTRTWTRSRNSRTTRNSRSNRNRRIYVAW